MKNMAKKFLATLLSAVMLLTATPLAGLAGIELTSIKEIFAIKAEATVFTGKLGDNVTYSFDADTHILKVEGTGNMYDFGPDHSWFSTSSEEWTYFDTVIICNGVTSIGNYAFASCTTLKSVVISDSVTSIGMGAFFGCPNLTSITIPDSVTSIGDTAFWSCQSLASVTIGKNVKDLSVNAFDNCTGIRTVNNYSILPIIAGDSAYGDLGYYADTVNWYGKDAGSCGDNVTYTFDAETLTLTISGTGDMTDYSYSDVAPWYNYQPCITTVVVENGVTSIGKQAFYATSVSARCKSLTSVTIPDSVTSIGFQAFAGCTSLTSITIPDNVTSIGNGAFNNTGYYNDSNNWEDGVLYIGKHLIDARGSSLPAEYAIKSSTITIADYAFYDLYISPTNITIPDSVSSIGYQAFSAFYTLTSITVSEDNEYYSSSNGVLFNKDKSELIQYPIGNSNTDYIIPNSVTSIGYKAFAECTNITTITIPSKVTSIGDFSFYCPNLTDVYYGGTKTQWNEILIGKHNEYLANATIHFFDPDTPPSEEPKEDDDFKDSVVFRVPSQSTINYGDKIILHVDVDLPVGAKVVWTPSNDNFEYTVSDDTKTCIITPESSGETVFTIKIVDKDGNVISEEYSQTVNANAGIFYKIIAFFKKLFGLTKTIPQMIDGIK